MTDPYHEGERQVQQRAGVRNEADRVGEIISPNLPLGIDRFLSTQTFLAVGSVDLQGNLWASILTGLQGFIQTPDLDTAAINARPAPGDPLAEGLQPGKPIAALAIDLVRRGRFRFNGQVREVNEQGFSVTVAESYTNCKKYIQTRRIVSLDPTPPAEPQVSDALSEAQRNWITHSDTFFIASIYNDRADVSHRGGEAGFVKVNDDAALTWADYVGNNMFQTLGNLTVDPRCGLVFVDFDTGHTLQLTGRATVEGTTERSTHFIPQRVVQIDHATPLRWDVLKPRG